MRASRVHFLASSLLFSCCVDALSLPNANRRDFLATSASYVLASPIPPSSASETGALQQLATTSKLQLPPIGLGAWAWGDSIFWKYDPRNDEDLKQVFEYALSQVGDALLYCCVVRSTTSPPDRSIVSPLPQNLAFFDTAELYGLGRSEDLIGRFRSELCNTQEEYDRVTVASKFAA